MARIRLNSDATVHWSREEVAEAHAGDFPADSLVDWGNGYVVASVEFLDATPPEPEEVEEVVADEDEDEDEDE